MFTLNNRVVNWKSSKHELTIDSTLEVEYISASEAAKEAVWIRKFTAELEVVPSVVDSITLYCDNNGVIAQAKELRSHQRSKFVLRRYHLIRGIIGRNNVIIEKLLIGLNIVDPMAKALP